MKTHILVQNKTYFRKVLLLASPVSNEIFDMDCYFNRLQYEDTLVLLFVLSGELQFSHTKYTFVMQQDDIFVINPFTLFSVYPMVENTHFAVLRFPPEIVQQAAHIFGISRIACSSCGRAQEPFQKIKRHFAEVVWLIAHDKSGNEFLIQAELLKLISELYNIYGICQSDGAEKRQYGAMNRIAKITQYIRMHYREKITLESAARYLNITPNYLSHFLKRTIGITFSQYLTQIRLHAVALRLQNSSQSITNIAVEEGFSSINSFYMAFKREFNMTPTQYKKMFYAPRQNPVYTDPVLRTLSKYRILTDGEQDAIQDAEIIQKNEVNILTRPSKVNHNWQQIINIGYASEGLNANIQNQLRILQNEIGFRYLRFHGILDDNMRVYNEKEDGSPFLQSAFFDMLVDFLDSVGLMPYMEFSFIPSLLSQKKYCPFAHQAYISNVKDISKWRFLISGIVEHCIERYGLNKVRQWYFSFLGFKWIQEFIPEDVMSVEEYYQLYYETYMAVKQIDEKLQFGGPATDSFMLKLSGKKSLSYWIEASERHNCRPDFIAMHFYPNITYRPTIAAANSLLTSDELSFFYNNDPDFMKNQLESVNTLLSGGMQNDIPLIIDEWDSTLWQRDPVNDTCYHSAYIAKNIMENFKSVHAMAQAVTSDFSEENQLGQDIFLEGLDCLPPMALKKADFIFTNYFRVWVTNNWLQGITGHYFAREKHCNLCCTIFAGIIVKKGIISIW